MYSILLYAIAFSAIRATVAQWPSHLDDEELLGGGGSPAISPQGGGGGEPGCCAVPVATPMPEIPLPTCPGGVAPLFGPDGTHAMACLPTSETCPANSACWYNGIDYYCCPMEGAPGYGPATPRPPIGYGGPPGGGGRRPGGRGRPPGGGSPSGPSQLPGSLPRGVNPPSESGGSSSEEVSPPASAPKGVNPPSSGEDASGETGSGPPGSLPNGVRPPGGGAGSSKPRPAGPGPWKTKARPTRPRGPPAGDSDTFPNPFGCCKGGGFHPPSHLPKNVNAPSERAIGYIQFHGGHNVWPPKETGKAKFGGPIKPDFLWFPGTHAHLTNELTCCGGEGTPEPSYGAPAPSPPAGYGRPQAAERK